VAIGDWFLARSEAFRLLMSKFRDHKQETVEAFSKVKAKHKSFESKLEEYEERIKELERVIETLNETQQITIARKKGKRAE